MNKEELKPQDLRIGNLVMCGSFVTFVSEIGIKNFVVTELDTSEGLFNYKSEQSNIKPIPLTEEWLLKFGFEKRDDQKYYHVEFNRTWVSLDSILVKWYGNALGGIMMLDYVHHLQNIFSTINNKELTLTEKT